MVDTVFILVSATCYPETIAPAAVQFSNTGDPQGIIMLLRRAQKRLETVRPEENPFESWGFDLLQDHLDILEGREFYSPSTDHKPPYPGARTSTADLKAYVEGQVLDSVFWGLCVAYGQGVSPRQVLTRGRLLPYLYEHSSFLEDAFTGALQGEVFQWLRPMAQISRDDVLKLLEHLGTVPTPDDAVEQSKAKAKWEALQASGSAVFVSSQFADTFGKPVSTQLRELIKLLEKVANTPELSLVQQID